MIVVVGKLANATKFAAYFVTQCFTSAVWNISFDLIFISASLLLDENVFVLIEGSNTKACSCALSEVTGIPLIRLHGDSRPSDQCDKTIQMSTGYRDYAHATLAILNTFHWESITLAYDGKRAEL